MQSVLIPVGLPGSGKTAVLVDEARNRGAVYICPDDIRHELTGDTSDQSRNREVWNRAYRRAAAALKNGYDVVIDATNTDYDLRQFLVQFCQVWSDDLSIELWYFATPIEECKHRNAARDRVVPDHVIDRKFQQLLDKPIDMGWEEFDVLVFVD